MLNTGLGQAQDHNELLSLIESSKDPLVTESKIADFFHEHAGALSMEELANCKHDLASKWYFQNWIISKDPNQLHLAINATQEALVLKRSLKNRATCSINKTLFNLAFFYSLSGRYYQAEELFQEIIEYGKQYCRDPQKDNKIQWSKQELGSLYIAMGDYYKALEIYDELTHEYHLDSVQSTDRSEKIFWNYIHKAELLIEIDHSNYFDEIRRTFLNAHELLINSNLECCFMLNRLNQSEGNWRADIGDYVTSIRLHKKVIENLPETDSINLSIAFNNLGYAQLSMGLYDIARVSILKAISYNEYLDDAYNNLGDFYLNQKKYSTALKNYNLAIGHDLEDQPLKHNDWLPSLNDVELAVNKQSLLNHLVTKANAWLTWYEHEPDPEHLEHALETFDLADQLVDLIRFESTEQQSKLYWREKGASLYLKAVEVCYLLNLPEKAFYFMERNKALLLLEDLGHEEAKRIAGLPLEAAQNEFKLRRQIFLAENDLSEAGRDEVLKDLKNAVRLAKTNYEDFIDSLNTAYPDYARYKRKIDILSFDDLRLKYLSADQFVLHYILNKEDGYGLVNTKDSSKLFRLGNIEQLNKDVGNYIQLLSSGISDLRTFNDLSHKLYQELIPEEIRGRLKGKRLLIVPDYNLQRIPFETLVSDISGPAYLLEDAEISYAYSLSLLERQSANIRKFNAPVIAMAPVKFGEEGLNTLKYSEAEAMAISDLFKGDLYLNEQASKSNFTQSAGGHKIIHLATHADLGNGENPWIAFSDGKLTLKEIYATPTQSEMVVLSACNTSQGDLKPGEGIMSLARGFFYSGANSVVSSLWPITDKGGREIMQEFYENLNKGDSKSAALRKAKLSYLQHTEVPELKHPYYWAGFVILGDNAPLVETSSAHWILIALAVILGLLFFGRRLLKLRQ